MSNKTDLDWLARNVHVWPTGDHQPWCHVYWKGGQRAVSGNCITVNQPCVRVEMSEWLARRAELQNKPSWEDAPEWAEWLAQDEDKEWKYLGKSPTKYVDGWTADKIKAVRSGEVLGDWRDTLEKRPEEFKSFTSIEDNQEQEMKQDNGWFERGELPPDGTKCEFCNSDDEWIDWHHCIFVGKDARGAGVISIIGDDAGMLYRSGNPKDFRPIRTERDLAIDEMCNVAGLDGLVFGLVAGKLYDAGYRKESK